MSQDPQNGGSNPLPKSLADYTGAYFKDTPAPTTEPNNVIKRTQAMLAQSSQGSEGSARRPDMSTDHDDGVPTPPQPHSASVSSSQPMSAPSPSAQTPETPTGGQNQAPVRTSTRKVSAPKAKRTTYADAQHAQAELCQAVQDAAALSERTKTTLNAPKSDVIHTATENRRVQFRDKEIRRLTADRDAARTVAETARTTAEAAQNTAGAAQATAAIAQNAATAAQNAAGTAADSARTAQQSAETARTLAESLQPETKPDGLNKVVGYVSIIVGALCVLYILWWRLNDAEFAYQRKRQYAMYGMDSRDYW